MNHFKTAGMKTRERWAGVGSVGVLLGVTMGVGVNVGEILAMDVAVWVAVCVGVGVTVGIGVNVTGASEKCHQAESWQQP